MLDSTSSPRFDQGRLRADTVLKDKPSNVSAWEWLNQLGNRPTPGDAEDFRQGYRQRASELTGVKKVGAIMYPNGKICAIVYGDNEHHSWFVFLGADKIKAGEKERFMSHGWRCEMIDDPLAILTSMGHDLI